MGYVSGISSLTSPFLIFFLVLWVEPRISTWLCPLLAVALDGPHQSALAIIARDEPCWRLVSALQLFSISSLTI